MKKIFILLGLSAVLTGCAVVPYDSPRSTVISTQYDNGYYNEYSVVNRYADPYQNYRYGNVYSPFIQPGITLNYHRNFNRDRNDYRYYNRRHNGNTYRPHRNEGQSPHRPNREHRQR